MLVVTERPVCTRCRQPFTTKGPHDGLCGRTDCIRSRWTEAQRTGAARMDAARAATGNLTCDLTVVGWDKRDINERPSEWAGKWRSR